MFSPQLRRDGDNADKTMYALDLVHLTQSRVFEENSLSSPKGPRRLSFPQLCYLTFFSLFATMLALKQILWTRFGLCDALHVRAKYRRNYEKGNPS